MVATISKVMAQMVDAVRDERVDAQRGRSRTVVATVTPSGPGPSRYGRWPRWTAAERAGALPGAMAPRADRHARAPRRAGRACGCRIEPSRFPDSCAAAVEALHRGLVADAETLPGLDHADATVLIRRLLREAVVVPVETAHDRRG